MTDLKMVNRIVLRSVEDIWSMIVFMVQAKFDIEYFVMKTVLSCSCH